MAGYRGQSAIIPHGVDTLLYRPIMRDECRQKHLKLFNAEGETIIPDNAFIVGNVNRNQPRKRLDLTIQYFAEWIKRVAGDPRQRIDNAYLYLHCAQNDTSGLQLAELAHYYGIDNRLIIPDAEEVTPAKGLPESEMPYVYGCFDVQVSTTAGEGWGLCSAEGMACGIPQILPMHSAFAEWAAGAAYMVPCHERQAHPVINTVGTTPAKEDFIRALDLFYRNPELRLEYAERARRCACQPLYEWDEVARKFDSELKRMVLIARTHTE
jgi:glycosyltransferase involved in cell wall biosynthesis